MYHSVPEVQEERVEVEAVAPVAAVAALEAEAVAEEGYLPRVVVWKLPIFRK
jgi:hypothetical protein